MCTKIYLEQADQAATADPLMVALLLPQDDLHRLAGPVLQALLYAHEVPLHLPEAEVVQAAKAGRLHPEKEVTKRYSARFITNSSMLNINIFLTGEVCEK